MSSKELLIKPFINQSIEYHDKRLIDEIVNRNKDSEIVAETFNKIGLNVNWISDDFDGNVFSVFVKDSNDRAIIIIVFECDDLFYEDMKVEPFVLVLASDDGVIERYLYMRMLYYGDKFMKERYYLVKADDIDIKKKYRNHNNFFDLMYYCFDEKCMLKFSMSYNPEGLKNFEKFLGLVFKGGVSERR